MKEFLSCTTPIVTCAELSRLETLSFSSGASAENYVDLVGKQVALSLLDFLAKEETKKPIYLLVGKGNNGADSLAAGFELLKKGFAVTALHSCPPSEGSSLLQLRAKLFDQAKGKSVVFTHSYPVASNGLFIDGLVGTGFRGPLTRKLEELILFANQSGLPIVSIDIPSGLDGTTGEVNSVCINATLTFSLTLPKLGFFVGKGPSHTGRLIPITFAMPVDGAIPSAHLMTDSAAKALLPPLERTRHKYQRGYVLGVAVAMGGAALLSSLSALRAGSGIVRLFHARKLTEELTHSFYELIKEPWDLSDPQRILQEAKRAQAIFLGPGLGRSFEVTRSLQTLLPQLQIPAVLDADALYFLSQFPKTPLPKKTLLTPHYKEMERLLCGESPSWEACRSFALSKEVSLILKGAPTVIFSKEMLPVVIHRGDPGMATAGSGDILTGILAALLSQGLSLEKAAALGVYLHALSGELAALEKTSYGCIASDLIETLPFAWKCLLQKDIF